VSELRAKCTLKLGIELGTGTAFIPGVSHPFPSQELLNMKRVQQGFTLIELM